MLAIVLARIKIVKLKFSLRNKAGLVADKDTDKKQRKVIALKTVAFLLANIADQIDVYAAPSSDPRINAKLKQNSAQDAALSISETLLAAVADSMGSEPQPTRKIFLS